MRRNPLQLTGNDPTPSWTQAPDCSPPTEAAGGGFLVAGSVTMASSARSMRPAAEERRREFRHTEFSGPTPMMVSGVPSQSTIETSRLTPRWYSTRSVQCHLRQIPGIQRGWAEPAAILSSRDFAGGQQTLPPVPITAYRTPARSRRGNLRSTSNQPATPPAGSQAEISALERSWALLPPRDPTTVIDAGGADLALFSIAADPVNISDLARHTSRLADAFSHGASPAVPGAISAVQQRLLTAALTSILALTREVRVHAALENEALEPLPVADDVALRPNSACVVCYVRLADMVLMPCWHLVLCWVWIN